MTHEVARPNVSVVVPTRNRLPAVSRLLRALQSECHATSGFEVIVVDDGSTDGTVQGIRDSSWPFPLRIVEQDGSGAAVARNAGARVATGEVLLFLDDDVEPQRGLIDAHAGAHARAAGIVGLGDLPPLIPDRTFLGIMLRTWWEESRQTVRLAGHRYSYRDLLSGHFSIRRDDFERLGGFDEALRCREDYELGYRALESGLQFRFLEDAVAAHHDTTTAAKAFHRKLQEGCADVHLAARHPAMAEALPLAWSKAYGRKQRALMNLAWRRSTAGDVVVRMLASTLPVFEFVRLRWRWRSIFDGVLSYWYWRGVSLAVRTQEELESRLREAAAVITQSPLVIDLAQGLEHAERQIETVRPRSIRLILGEAHVGTLPDYPGWEPLRGAHLRPLLGGLFRAQYLRALTEAGMVPRALAPAAGVTAGARGERNACAV